MNRICVWLTMLPLLGVIAVGQVQAQSITPAADGTNTVVTPDGKQFDITGGQTSKDGANLFHSLTQFGLSQDQIANFISRPEILNILTRINGGDPSVINGLIQVTGGKSNLFLMNPAGIIFGQNASLNLPAALTVTTANGIGFGSNWFSAVGNNNYAELVGNPSAFAFTTENPGAIINAGDLSVGEGQNLTLLGGTVASTGKLSAPGGQITVAAVPGKSVVRISQAGNLLSLDVQPIAANDSQPNNWILPVLSLPELLTGGGGGNATGITVYNDGRVVLTGSDIYIEASTGTVIASGTLDASTGDFSGQDVAISGSALADITGNVTLQATKNISVFEDLNFQVGDTGQASNAGQEIRFSAGESFEASDTIRTQGRSIEISSPNINLYDYSAIVSNGGNIALNSQESLNLTSSELNSGGGNIALDSKENLNLTSSELNSGGGNIVLDSKENLNLTSSELNSGGGNIVLDSKENLNLTSSKLKSFGDISLLAQNTVKLSDSSDDGGQVTAIASGNLSIQGNAGINIQLSNNPLSLFKSDGNITLVSDGVITGNARFKSGGTFSTKNLAGGFGNFKSDPILINLNGDPYQTLISSIGDVNISSIGDVNFGNYEGLALKVESQGSITGGDIKITGLNPTLTGSDPDIAILTSGPALILRAGVPTLANSPQLPSGEVGGATFTSTGSSSQPANITIEGNIEIVADTGSNPGPVILSAPGSITVQYISSNSDVNLTSGSGNIKTGAIRADRKVVLSAVAGNIEVDTIMSGRFDSSSGDISITSGGLFRAIVKTNFGLLVNDSSIVDVNDFKPSDRLYATIFAVTPANDNNEPYVNTGTLTIKTKNQPPYTEGPNDGKGSRINIEVGSETFLVGTGKENGSLKEGVSGTAGAITTITGNDSSVIVAVTSRTFGKVTPVTSVDPGNPVTSVDPGNPVTSVNPGNPVTSVNPGNPVTSVNPGNPVTSVNPGNLVTSVDPGNPVASVDPGNPVASVDPGNSVTSVDPGNPVTSVDPGNSVTSVDPENSVTSDTPITTVINDTGSSKNEAQSETRTFGVLSLDKSLVARLKYSGHATKLTLSNDGKGELTGSNLNARDKEEENSLNEVFNLDGNLLHITVLTHS